MQGEYACLIRTKASKRGIASTGRRLRPTLSYSIPVSSQFPWEDSTIRLHDGYTIGGRIFPMALAPSLTVNVLTPLSGNGSVSSPISPNNAALANQVPVLANAPIIGQGVTGNPLDLDLVALAALLANTVPVAHDASLVGNGTVGAPLSVNWGLAPQQPVSHNGTLSGAGTVAIRLLSSCRARVAGFGLCYLADHWRWQGRNAVVA